MQIFYSNIKVQGSQAISPRERREMRDAMIDYGALQPSLVPRSDSADIDGDVSFVIRWCDAR
jgi:hypothetical protein